MIVCPGCGMSTWIDGEGCALPGCENHRVLIWNQHFSDYIGGKTNLSEIRKAMGVSDKEVIDRYYEWEENVLHGGEE